MKNISFYLFCCFILTMLSIFIGCASRHPIQPVSIPTEPKGIEIPTILIPPIPDKVKLYAGSRKWDYIVIHHSATHFGNAAKFDKMHREVNGWSRGLGYDFVIGNGNGSGNGQIEVGPRWIKQIDGAHAGVKKYNRHGIGICLVGNFEENSPTENQISSLVGLIKFFQERYNIPSENVILHRHVKKTACPGTNFPYFEILSNIHAR